MNKVASLCFTALTLTTIAGMPLTKQDYLEAILIDIKILQNILPNREGTFYTPKNTGMKCARSGIECFMKEINILEEENEDNRNITNIIQNIKRNHSSWKRVAERDEKEENVCPRCESYESQDSVVFLNHMIELVQFAFHVGL